MVFKYGSNERCRPVVAIFLALINKCPWLIEPVIALKRILIVTFPVQ